jgi:hypothetical protein
MSRYLELSDGKWVTTSDGQHMQRCMLTGGFGQGLWKQLFVVLEPDCVCTYADQVAAMGWGRA